MSDYSREPSERSYQRMPTVRGNRAGNKFAVSEMIVGTRERFEYYSCAACDTLQILNAPQGKELARHYPPIITPKMFRLSQGLSDG
jgi:hypothetical protein